MALYHAHPGYLFERMTVIIFINVLVGHVTSDGPLLPNYQGCYGNTHDYLKGVLSEGRHNISSCLSVCFTKGDMYAILRGLHTPLNSHSDCFCHQKLLINSQLANEACAMLCPANKSLTCGNRYEDNLSIYRPDCQRGYWGKSSGSICSKECHCENSCHNQNGTCLGGGCESGWQSAGNGRDFECDKECNHGSFGPGCRSRCYCKKDASCDHVTGVCMNGCAPGYRGHNCSLECNHGSFGPGCRSRCYCKKDASCDHVTGVCMNGCAPGYRGHNCSLVCNHGTFGPGCGSSCHCKNDASCDHVKGVCRDGCAPGYRGNSCTLECNQGSFGPGCRSRCYCKKGASCDHVTGVCMNGCAPGYRGHNCSLECHPGTFGPGCGSSCHCKNDASCDHVTGVCRDGCTPGYRGHNCTLASSSDVQTAGLAGGIAAFAVVALVAVAVIVVVFLRRRKLNSNMSTTTEDAEQGAQKMTKVGSGKAPALPPKGIHFTEEEEEEGTGDEAESADEENSEDNDDAEYMNVLRSKPIFLADLKRVVTQAMTDKMPFKDEYESIPKNKKAPWEVASQEHLKPKNRFRDILPYDHSRVVLSTIDDDPLSTYINACFIEGYGKHRTYIAAQGPNIATLDDFWRLIWEQNVSTVVMLTSLEERGKKKCEQYWPDGSSISFGNVIVTTEKVQVLPEFTWRELKVTQNGHSRQVRQHHFTSWPDHGVPQHATSLLNFRRKILTEVDDSGESGPILVHCSAGVGRTGVFLAIDFLVQQAREEERVDIAKAVNLLRERRVKMVQTRVQYAFVYNALLEAVWVGETLIACHQFLDVYDQMLNPNPYTSSTMLEEQFKMLETMKSSAPSESYNEASKKENREKNKSDKILPADSAYPKLMTVVKGTTDYINAVFVDGRRNKHEYIATQMPLAETMVDFWRMVADYKCPCIVMLNKGDADEEKLGRYWPDAGEPMTHGPFKISLENEMQEDSLVIRDLQLTGKMKFGKRKILQVHLMSWPEDSNGNAIPARAIFNIRERIQRYQKTSDIKGPVVVHCADGTERCGVYIAVSNLVDMMAVEQELDVFQVVQTIRAHRPHFISSQDQYRQLFEASKEYMDDFGTYSNLR